MKNQFLLAILGEQVKFSFLSKPELHNLKALQKQSVSKSLQVVSLLSTGASGPGSEADATGGMGEGAHVVSAGGAVCDPI